MLFDSLRRTDAEFIGGRYQDEVNLAITNGADGWVQCRPIGHMCFPPQVYPPGVGPHSSWACRSCGTIWEADGCRVMGDYPQAVARNDHALGPERWRYVTGVKKPEQIELENAMYDWRPLGPYQVKLYRRMIECMGGKWKDLSD